VVGDVRTLPASQAENGDGESAQEDEGSGSDDAEQVQLLAVPVEEMK